MYTDEPVPKKDVASGQNFSRFNPLTKITVFARLGYPTPDISQGSWNTPWPLPEDFLQRFTSEKDIHTVFTPKEAALEQVGAAEKVLLWGKSSLRG